MKPHPTIPHHNLQPAEGKCNLQPVTCRRQTPRQTPRRPSHFQLLKVFNFALLLLLATITLSCTDEKPLDTTDPTLPVHLNPGEQAVTLTLGGMGKATATAKSEARGLSMAIIETEAVVNTLDLYCFVNLAQGNTTDTDASAKADYTLERVYKYIPGGSDNDFTLVPAADGYQTAIGIPKDDRLRYFLAVANDPKNSRTYTAVPVGSDRTTATPYADISAWTGATGTYIQSYIPATATVPKRLAMNDGSYTEVDEPFSAEDLAGGLFITLYRLAARVDISNPSTTNFIVTKMQCSYKTNITLFPPYTLTKTGLSLQGSNSIDNAEYIAGAAYFYPYSDAENEIILNGTLNGTKQTLSVNATLKPNTRYILRVRNDGSNVNATIEVAPWNEGSDIDAPLSGKYNATYTLAPVISSSLVQDDGTTINHYAADIEQDTRTIRAYTSASSIVTVTGADGDEKPVGIIIPPAFADKITLSASTTTASGAWQVTIEDATNSSGGGGILMSGRAQIGGLGTRRVRPESCPLTFVTRTADGTYKYDEWTLVLDILTDTSTPLANFPTVQVFEDGTLSDVTDDTSAPVYLPAFAEVLSDNGIPTEKYIYISSTEDYTKTYAAYTTEDWLTMTDMLNSEMMKLNPLYVHALDDNFTGKERRAQLVTRRQADHVTDTVVEERRYTVIQLPVTAEDEARMAPSATIRLESGHKTDELYMEGTTIYVQPFASNNSGMLRDIMGQTVYYPFSVLSPGGKPVIINLPDVDWLTIETRFNPSQYIPSTGMTSGREETPPGFFRQFTLRQNTTGQTRRAYFDIITIVDGKRVTTTYTVVQYPETGDKDQGEEM